MSTTDVAGGAERVALLLHREFQARGHAASLAVGSRTLDDPTILELNNDARREGLRSFRARVRDAIGLQYVDFPASRNLLGQGAAPWDLVVLHNLHGGYFDPADVGAIAARVPTILVLHDMWLLTGHCAHPLGCERWRDGCGTCPDLTIYPSVRFDLTRRNLARKRKSLQESAAAVTSPARWLCEVAQHPPLTRGPVHWLPNPVDLTVFRPQPQADARERLGLPVHRPIVLVPASLAQSNSFKDPMLAASAITQLTGLGALLVSIGDGQSRSADHMELPRVRAPKDMATYYAACDVVVSLSKAETAPLVPLEAAACRRPVVATDIPGYREVLAHGRTGVLVPPGDVRGLTDAVRGVLTDNHQTSIMVDEAARIVAERHDAGQVAAQWVEWIERLIG